MIRRRSCQAPLPASSYALLAHLASRPMAASELVRRMATGSPSYYIPRAESMVYAQVKELAERGLARAAPDRTARRARTVYTLTPAGRAALRAFLAEPASGSFRLDWPPLLKVAFGHLGTREQLLRHLDALARELARHRGEEVAAVLAGWAERGFEFPERAQLTLWVGELHLRLADSIQGWLEDARRELARLPSTRTRPAQLAGLRRRAAARHRKLTGAAKDGRGGSGRESNPPGPRRRDPHRI